MKEEVIRFEVRSFTNKNAKPYVVEGHDGGKRWTCTCPHWQFRLSKSGTRCKHIDKAIDDMKRNEAIQRDIAKQFEDGWAFDMDEPEVPKPDLFEDDDVQMAPAG